MSLLRNDKPFRELVPNGDYGLKTAYTDEEYIDSSNVVKVVGETISTFYKNRARAEYLWRYKNGDQPVLYRTKTIRDDINNPICENQAWSIIHFLNGQETGEPIQTIALSDKEEVGKYVDIFNDYCRGANKQLRDINCGEWTHTTGTGFKAVQRKIGAEIPFRIVVPTPLNTYIVYQRATEEPLLAVQFLKDTDGQEYKLCYTDTHEYRIKNSSLMATVNHNGDMVTEKIHAFGGIPIVEYPNNQDRISDIELVITMLDSINEIQANRSDAIGQFVQSWIVFQNCMLDNETFNSMKEQGAIMVNSNNGENKAAVSILTQELNQSESQVAKDDLFDNILRILSIPSDQGNTGGDTQGAVELRNNWSKSKQNAKLRDAFIKESDKRLDNLILHIINQETNNSCPLKTMDYDVQINRNPTDNLQVRAQVLQMLLQSGTHPKLAVEKSGLWGDSEKAYLVSKPYLDAKYKTAAELEEQERRTQELMVQNGETQDTARGVLSNNGTARSGEEEKGTDSQRP